MVGSPHTPDQVLADRQRVLPAPPAVVWDDLAAPRATAERAWLRLLDDERPPIVRDAHRPLTLTWTGLWQGHPELRILLLTRPRHGSGASGTGETSGTAETLLRFQLLAPPTATYSDATVGHLRHRLNHLLFADLRFSYGQ